MTLTPVAYNLAAAAQASGLTIYKLRDRIRNNKIAVRYEGKDVLIEHEELLRYIRTLPQDRADA
jgi:hypothetical protein